MLLSGNIGKEVVTGNTRSWRSLLETSILPSCLHDSILIANAVAVLETLHTLGHPRKWYCDQVVRTTMFGSRKSKTVWIFRRNKSYVLVDSVTQTPIDF